LLGGNVSAQSPIILLVYANDRVDPSRHLRSLADEIGLIRDALRPAEQAGLCRVVIEANASAERVLTAFQDAGCRHRIAVFHYAGHADGYRLLLEATTGQRLADPHAHTVVHVLANEGNHQGAAHAAGLAAFLGAQRGLELVFLNGCSTAPQVQGLLDAGCPAVVATSQAIDDQVAAAFAGAFYRGLGGGAGLASAFDMAGAAIRTTHGDEPRGLYWGAAAGAPPLTDRWPWELCIRPGAEPARHWNLPEAAGDPLFGLPALPRLDLPESPFRHLSWFDREHAEVFFGRAFQVRDLFDRVTAPDAPPILLFYGQSGVGKSSVLAAGLLPRIEATHRVHYLRRDPALGLLGTLMQPLGAGVDEPGTAWHQAEVQASAPLLLILDQAEEVFTRPAANPAEEFDALLAGLQAIFGQPDTRPRGRLILSFRKEWLPEIEARLADRRLPRGRLFLQGLDRRGIIAAVEGATRGERLRNAYGLQIDDGLAAEIADDLLADPDSPIAPTLQILLTKLWQAARDQDDSAPRFTRALYLQLKRDGILLKDFLDQQLAALEQWRPEAVQSGLALDLLAAHTTPIGTADQCTDEALSMAYPQVQETLPALLQRCKDGYLLTDIPSTGRDPVKGTRLAHDTLAPLVRARFEESDHPGQRARRILENRAVEWDDGDVGALLDDADLAVVEGGQAGMREWNNDERRLIEASRQARARWRRAQQRRRVVGALGLLAVLLAGGFSAWQWQQTDAQTRIAVARLQTFQAKTEAAEHPVRALLLAIEAVKRPLAADGTRLGSAETVLRERMAAISGIPLTTGASIAFDPTGRLLAVGSESGSVHLWDFATLDTPFRILPGHDGEITEVAFDSAGRWLATTGYDKTLRLWDLGEPDLTPRILHNNKSEIPAFSFDPEGRGLATSGDDGKILFWYLDDPDSDPALLMDYVEPVEQISFDPSGHWFAAISQGGFLDLWDIKNADANSPLLNDIEVNIDVNSLAFGPEGRWLATVAKERDVFIWDLTAERPKPTRLLGMVSGGAKCGTDALAFDRRGRWLAGGGDDGLVRLWDLANLDMEPRVLRGHTKCVFALEFGPGGELLASISSDRTVKLWNIADLEADPQTLQGHERSPWVVRFHPSGRWLATLGGSEPSRLWHLPSAGIEPKILSELPGSELSGIVYPLAFSDEDRWLAAGAQDGAAHLFDLSDPDGEPLILRGHEGGIFAIDFDPDGRWLATGGTDGDARLWYLADPEAAPWVLPGHQDPIYRIEFDPKGRWLATGSKDGTYRLWGLASLGAAPQVLTVANGGTGVLAFDPGGRWLATRGADDTAELWDLTDLAAKPRTLRGHTDEVLSLAFDPGGRWLATGAVDGTARLWNLDYPDAQPRVMMGHEGGVYTLAFDPNSRWLAAGSRNSGNVRLWVLSKPGAKPRLLRAHDAPAGKLEFSRDGRWLAVYTEDGTFTVWDPEDQNAEPWLLRTEEDAGVLEFAFDHSGRLLATGHQNGGLRLWQLDIHGLLEVACRLAGRNLSSTEWRQILGDLPYQATCSQYPSESAFGISADTRSHSQ
jgi:WD40 repeat protein